MKIFYKVLLMGVFALSASQAIAASVTGLNTFSSGTPALASEVNDNFTSVKSAVDDNDSRVKTLESSDTDHATRLTDLETSDGEQSTRLTDLETSNSSVNLRISNLESGAVSVNGQSFKLRSGSSCTENRGSHGIYFPTGNNCVAYASIQLPHNGTLTSLSCFVNDNTGSSLAIQAYLDRANTSGNFYYVGNLFSTPASINSTSAQNITDSTVVSTSWEVIDNTKYSYILSVVVIGTGNASTNLRLRSCTVNYI